MEVNSTDTITEPIEIFKMAKSNGWENMAILTSDFHVERVREMISHIKELAEKKNLADEDFVKAFEFFKKGGNCILTFLMQKQYSP